MNLSDKVKTDIRDFLRKVYKDTKGKVPDEEWNDFETLFWDINRFVKEPYIQVEEKSNSIVSNSTS